MKKYLSILFFLFCIHTTFAQDDPPGGAARLKEKMVEYIQNKLGLSKPEAERFEPLFTDYLNQLREVKKEHKGDRLLLQDKVIDVRIKFREKIKPVIGEKRSNDVFQYEREFVQKIQDINKDRMQERKEGRPNKRKNSEL
jgi:hypothetical protein